MRITQHPQLYLFHEKNDSYQSLKELVVVPFNHFQISEWKIISEAKRRGMSVSFIDNSIYLDVHICCFLYSEHFEVPTNLISVWRIFVSVDT